MDTELLSAVTRRHRPSRRSAGAERCRGTQKQAFGQVASGRMADGEQTVQRRLKCAPDGQRAVDRRHRFGHRAGRGVAQQIRSEAGGPGRLLCYTSRTQATR